MLITKHLEKWKITFVISCKRWEDSQFKFKLHSLSKYAKKCLLLYLFEVICMAETIFQCLSNSSDQWYTRVFKGCKNTVKNSANFVTIAIFICLNFSLSCMYDQILTHKKQCMIVDCIPMSCSVLSLFLKK